MIPGSEIYYYDLYKLIFKRNRDKATLQTLIKYNTIFSLIDLWFVFKDNYLKYKVSIIINQAWWKNRLNYPAITKLLRKNLKKDHWTFNKKIRNNKVLTLQMIK